MDIGKILLGLTEIGFRYDNMDLCFVTLPIYQEGVTDSITYSVGIK